MLNHKTIFKQKSKILLIIISIFGLVFSYSCSCRSGGDPTRVNGGTASGNWTMQLTSDGKGYKQEATISFEKATATLKSVTDVDASANTTLTVDDFVYEGNTLKLKKDTTDPSVIDTTTAAKITWDGTTVKKVKATFTLTPSASDVDLDATEKEVVISIKKIKKIDKNNFESVLKKMTEEDINLDDGTPADGNVVQALFHLNNGTYSATGIYEIKNETTSSPIVSFTDKHLSRLHEYTDYYLPYLEEIKTATVGNKEGGIGSSFYTITYSIVFADDFESDLATVKIKFVSKE